MKRLKRFVCFLVGHRCMLRVAPFFGIFHNERLSAWSYCKRCGRLLKFYG